MNQKFATTSWTLVLAAQGKGSPEARAALAGLCEAYWLPIWFFIRRQGHSHEDAQDLTQQFFSSLLERDALQSARPVAGRFRSFLLACLKNFLHDQYDRQMAQKRGGHLHRLDLDFADAGRLYGLGLCDDDDPESVFARRWALTVVDRAVAMLREDFTSSGKQRHFDILKAHLTGETPCPTTREAALELDMSEGAVRVAVHRMRKRLGALLQAEIAETVSDLADVHDELQFLLRQI